MPMQVTRLTTHWSPVEAQTILEFLDLLRDQLCEAYGDQIASFLREACSSPPADERQTKLPFDDDVDF